MHDLVFGFGAHGDFDDGPELLRMARQADRDGRWIGGSAGQWVEELTGAVVEHGASGFTLFSPEGGTQDIASVGRWAAEIAPAVREAVAKERG